MPPAGFDEEDELDGSPEPAAAGAGDGGNGGRGPGPDVALRFGDDGDEEADDEEWLDEPPWRDGASTQAGYREMRAADGAWEEPWVEDDDETWELDDDEPWDAPGWQGRALRDRVSWAGWSIALAAVHAAITARRAFRDGLDTGLEPLELQALVVLGSVDAAPDERLTVRGLASALAVQEATARSLIRGLVSNDLLQQIEDAPDGEHLVVTEVGFAALGRWLERIAPAFGDWPPKAPQVDDAG